MRAFSPWHCFCGCCYGQPVSILKLKGHLRVADGVLLVATCTILLCSLCFLFASCSVNCVFLFCFGQLRTICDLLHSCLAWEHPCAPCMLDVPRLPHVHQSQHGCHGCSRHHRQVGLESFRHGFVPVSAMLHRTSRHRRQLPNYPPLLQRNRNASLSYCRLFLRLRSALQAVTEQ